jgi:hypothetical protein
MFAPCDVFSLYGRTKEARDLFLMKDVKPALVKIVLSGEVERAITIAHAFLYRFVI